MDAEDSPDLSRVKGYFYFNKYQSQITEPVEYYRKKQKKQIEFFIEVPEILDVIFQFTSNYIDVLLNFRLVSRKYWHIIDETDYFWQHKPIKYDIIPAPYSVLKFFTHLHLNVFLVDDDVKFLRNQEFSSLKTLEISKTYFNQNDETIIKIFQIDKINIIIEELIMCISSEKIFEFISKSLLKLKKLKFSLEKGGILKLNSSYPINTIEELDIENCSLLDFREYSDSNEIVSSNVNIFPNLKKLKARNSKNVSMLRKQNIDKLDMDAHFIEDEMTNLKSYRAIKFLKISVPHDYVFGAHFFDFLVKMLPKKVEFLFECSINENSRKSFLTAETFIELSKKMEISIDPHLSSCEVLSDPEHTHFILVKQIETKFKKKYRTIDWKNTDIQVRIILEPRVFFD
eukprot:gene10679-3300_t